MDGEVDIDAALDEHMGNGFGEQAMPVSLIYYMIHLF
jgi:hypothetical protein